MKKLIGVVAAVAVLVLALFAGCGKVPKATLDKTELKLGLGEQATITAVLENCTDVTWVSSDEAVVTVTAEEGGEKAAVKAVGKGTANVEVKSGSKTVATCSVTVDEAVLTVFLPEGNKKLVLVTNQTVTVKALSTVPIQGEVVWKSADESIATVEYQGLTARVTAIARGDTVITVSADGNTASFELLVGKTA